MPAKPKKKPVRLADNRQLELMPLPLAVNDDKKQGRAGTFVDNMKLPVHRWFRFAAGFSAEWVQSVISEFSTSHSVLLDPFAGSGTTLIAADMCGMRSFGVEAHPFVARIANAKLLWPTPPQLLRDVSRTVLQLARTQTGRRFEYPPLIQECYSAAALQQLDSLRVAWEECSHTAASDLVWLAITAILRVTAHVGTAQWQYVLPNRKKKSVVEPYFAFERFITVMCGDLEVVQTRALTSLATVIEGDAQTCAEVPNASIDLVITSPPYANNYDYADATRLEMSFWGSIGSWGDLHEAVRKHLIVSSSQHASKERLDLEKLLSEPVLDPIKAEITQVCGDLSIVRLSHGGKKHYHTMIAAYFADMARAWLALRRVCKPGARACFVIGDSAPYGVYVPVDRWLGELAIAAGFESFEFEKIRDRNIKWKNRKHRVPLHEGRLWVKG